MKDYIKLAWRNIWRNKRRTLITMASVFFAVFFALLMRSLQIGAYGHMTRSMVENYSGYLQIHKQGYWDDQTMENTFVSGEELDRQLENLPGITGVIPRLESFALASSGEHTKGVLVMGIDPEKEALLTNPEEKLQQGSMLEAGDQGVLLAEKLAAYLSLEVGDTLVLIGQGYHATSASGLFPVRGIFAIPYVELEKRLIYMSLPETQYFYSAPNRLTSLCINMDGDEKMYSLQKELQAILDPQEYEVLNWTQISPELYQQIKGDEQGGYLMLGLLYIVVGFGVLGTVLMMTAERKREFGVMIAVGMHRLKLAWIVVLEMIMLGILGILAGIAGSIPLIHHFVNNPITFSGEAEAIWREYGFEPLMPAAWSVDAFIGQSAIVLTIFLIAIALPVWAITRIRPDKALRA